MLYRTVTCGVQPGAGDKSGIGMRGHARSQKQPKAATSGNGQPMPVIIDLMPEISTLGTAHYFARKSIIGSRKTLLKRVSLPQNSGALSKLPPCYASRSVSKACQVSLMSLVSEIVHVRLTSFETSMGGHPLGRQVIIH